ncbi:MAG: ferritin family protein [Sedimentisphaerales bacterium]|nr:ferritin family protein [Sedimentisphaerales bacterium]
MGMPFTADEVFEMAEQIERNGAKFYRAAAEKFPTVSQLLLELAAMEDNHEKTFIAMRSELSGTEAEPIVFDPDAQAQLYLQAMADEHIFNIKSDPIDQLAGLGTPNEVLKTAMGLERDSIAFYTGLKESVSRKAGKDKVEAIIKEEINHIAILSRKMEALK